MPEQPPEGERRKQLRRATDRGVTEQSKLDLILDVTRRLMSMRCFARSPRAPPSCSTPNAPRSS